MTMLRLTPAVMMKLDADRFKWVLNSAGLSSILCGQFWVGTSTIVLSSAEIYEELA